MAAKLKLVQSSSGSPRPLARHGQALWNRVCRDFDIGDAYAVEMLCQAAEAEDRLQACSAVIKETGVAVVSTGGIVRANPLLRDEIALRAFVGKCLERLGLNHEAAQRPGRPSGNFGVTSAKVESA